MNLDLADIVPGVAGPKRPQDRINLPELKDRFVELFQKPIAESGYNKTSAQLNERYLTKIGLNGHTAQQIEGGGTQDSESAPTAVPSEDGHAVAGLESDKDTAELTESEMMSNRPTPDHLEASEIPDDEFPRGVADLGHGDVVIAAITSCTNTSNPSVMLAAGLVAKKAVEKGLSIKPTVKSSLAPGSRVVTEYLTQSGLLPYLDQIGFHVVGYGCTTCIGNSGPLDPRIEEVITSNDLVVASVLSGNRNFEARVHQNVKANFLMSPPLVVAFALAGTVLVDTDTDAIGEGTDGPVYLKDIWPTMDEVREHLQTAFNPETFRRLYSDFAAENPLWNDISAPTGDLYKWDADSTYIQEPPFFENFGMEPGAIANIEGARPLAIFGDSVTTDHISPAGAIKPSSPAGKYLQDNGVKIEDFNSYGSRRGNDRVMTRGTFANVRIKNLMVPGSEGGVTKLQPSGEQMSIYDAAQQYAADGTPLMIFAGQEYGTGSSRDWAAKGTRLLGC